MKKHGRTSGQSVNPKPWRLKAGIGIFVLSIVLPVVGTPLVAYSQRRFAFGVFLFVCGRLTFLMIPLVRSSSLNADWKSVLSVLCVFGLPDLFTVLAVAVLGKEGFARLKQLFFSLLKRFAPAAQVGRTRYRIGLVMFFIPIVFGWAYPYLNEIVSGFQDYRVVLSVCGDALFVASFFVLGGDFWEKLRNLFIHRPVSSGGRSDADDTLV